jgi:hypothetical protein
MSNTRKLPKVGEKWRIKVITMLKARRDETFVGKVHSHDGFGYFTVIPEGKDSPMPVKFGLPWFVEEV